jgi:hypothetical protein
MPGIARFLGILIAMYYNEHGVARVVEKIYRHMMRNRFT